MTLFLTTILILHVMLGLVGIIASYAAWMALLKKTPSLRILKISALLATVSLFGAWIAGGIYYVVHYGTAVKPRILAGNYAWVHQIVTEAKEHMFLLLPFAALAMAAVIYRSGDRLAIDERMRWGVTFLAGVITVIAVIVALAGIVISGAAR